VLADNRDDDDDDDVAEERGTNTREGRANASTHDGHDSRHKKTATGNCIVRHTT